MELFTNEDINKIIKQLGYTKALHWSVKSYSDDILGYLGEHLTLTVEVESAPVLKFFVKCIPRSDEWKAKYLIDHGFFEKEYTMFSLFEKFMPGKEKWRPSVFLAKKDLFVFEDVVQLGYTMPCDRDTLTLEEVKACVETMARFHSQSYIYEEDKSRVLNRPYRIWEDYSDHLQEPNKSQNWRNTGMNAAISLLKVYSRYKDHPNFSQNIESAIPKLFDDLLSMMKPHLTYRNVVTHRDLWMNNIFFKNKTSDALHALFVDFQTVLYCPPMYDFASLLYFNTRKNFRDRYLHELMELYFSIVRDELKTANIDIDNIMDRESLKKCYEASIKFGILQAALIIPITLITKEINRKLFADPQKSKLLYDVSRSTELLEIAETDIRYRNHVLELLDEIVEKYIY